MKRITRVAPTGLLMFLLAACSVFGGAAPEPECSVTYDLRTQAATLGSDEAFDAAVRDAIAAGTPTTLADVTAAAGWSPAWDRVVIVEVGMPPEHVAQIAGTPSTCWVGVPSLAGGERPEGYYAFLSGDQIVQTVHWTDSGGDVLGWKDSPVVQADAPLAVLPTPGRMTTGQLVPE